MSTYIFTLNVNFYVYPLCQIYNLHNLYTTLYLPELKTIFEFEKIEPKTLHPMSPISGWLVSIPG